MHRETVDEIYDRLESGLEYTNWDRIYRNLEYFSPDEDSKYFDNPKGEMDVCLYNEDERRIKYIEVKTRKEDVRNGVEQVERAKEHFEELGFELEAEVILSVHPDE